MDGLLEMARAVRAIPDRLLHRSRYLATSRILGAQAGKRRALVVCHGNICRSPFAEQVLSLELKPLGVEVGSAGFLAAGRPCPPEAVQAARQFGIDLSEHRSRPLTVPGVRAADLIVVMDTRQAAAMPAMFGTRSPVVILGDCDPQSPDTRTITDPVGQSFQVFVEVYARIERCVNQLAAMVRRGAAARAR